MKISVLLSVFLFSAFATAAREIDSRELRCLVCRKTIHEVQDELRKIDPTKEMEVGQYRLDAKGNAVIKKVPLAKSEIHISDTLDKICEKMDNYVRATYKSSGRLVLLNLFSSSGGMNPDMSKVDFIHDEDLNKSLKFLCESIVDEFEESIIAVFQSGTPNIQDKICTQEARFCDEDADYEEKNLDDEVESAESINKTEL